MDPDEKEKEVNEIVSSDDTHVVLKIDDVTITTKINVKQEDSNG